MTTDTPMVERLGSVIEGKLRELTLGDYTLNYDRPSGLLASEEVAIAVLECLRTPTPEMVEAMRADVAAGEPAMAFVAAIERAMKSTV